MSTIHPAAAEHLRKRWMRPDAYRFARPGTPEAKMPGHLHSWAAVARPEAADAAMSAAENDAFDHELLHLRWLVKSMRLELALRCFQEKHSPDQPRVPAGNSEGGQWTSGGGGSDASGETSRTELTQLLIRICMAGSRSISIDQWGNQSYWVDYACTDGHIFRRYGSGSSIPGFIIDPRRF